MATFWEIAALSVSNLFSLYFVYLYYLFISRFGIKSGICLLIAPVPVHCFSLTFTYMFSIKEIVRSVENELILLDLFEWRAVSVLFLLTFNPKLENNVRP